MAFRGPDLIDGTELLAFVAGSSAPTGADEVAYAEATASAVNGAVWRALDLVELPADPDLAEDLLSDLHSAALIVGAERWKRREAPWGVTGYSAADGSAIRVGLDDLGSVRSILNRWSPTAGVGIG